MEGYSWYYFWNWGYQKFSRKKIANLSAPQAICLISSFFYTWDILEPVCNQTVVLTDSGLSQNKHLVAWTRCREANEVSVTRVWKPEVAAKVWNLIPLEVMEIRAFSRRESADLGKSAIKGNEAVYELEMRDVTLRVEDWLESEVPREAFMMLPCIWLFSTAEKTQLANMYFKSKVHFHLERNVVSCTESLSNACGDCDLSIFTGSGAWEWVMVMSCQCWHIATSHWSHVGRNGDG